MSDNLRLAQVEWPILADLRAAATAIGSGPAALRDAIAALAPRATPEDLLRLNVAERVGAPPGALLPLQVRADPPAHADAAVTWLLANGAHRVADEFVVELARVGPWHESRIPGDLLLAYYSEAYRLVVTWSVDEAYQQSPVFDGDPAILNAVGGRLRPQPSESVLLAPEEVTAIAVRLARLHPPPEATGDLRALNEFWEDFYDPRESFAPIARDMLAWLHDLYLTAARFGRGMRVIT